MTRLRVFVPFALAAALAGAIAAHGATATNECNGIRNCLRAQGPWVVVPAHGTASYLLDCPRRRGILAGLDARVTSTDIHIWFDGQLSAPISPGRTTTRYAFLHAVSGLHRRGAFQPLIGCIPVNPNSPSLMSAHLESGSPLLVSATKRTGQARTTTSASAAPGPQLLLAATTLSLRPGQVRTTTIGCISGQKLVDSWYAIAFRTIRVPNVALADAVRVQRTPRGNKIAVSIATSEALPRGTGAEVQLGVMCSPS